MVFGCLPPVVARYLHLFSRREVLHSKRDDDYGLHPDLTGDRHAGFLSALPGHIVVLRTRHIALFAVYTRDRTNLRTTMVYLTSRCGSCAALALMPRRTRDLVDEDVNNGNG